MVHMCGEEQAREVTHLSDANKFVKAGPRLKVSSINGAVV